MKTRACVWCCFLFMIFQYFFIMCFCFVQIHVCRPFFILYYTLISFIPYTMSVIQKHTHSLQELNLDKKSWNIVARVVRLWFVEDYTKGKTPFSMEIVLQQSTFVVKATIKHVLDQDDWWYTACICNKAVYPDSKMYFFVKSVTSMSLRLHLGLLIFRI